MEDRRKDSVLEKNNLYKDFLIRMNFPENMPDYSQQSYWEARYQMEENQHYQWYVGFQILKPYFIGFVDTSMEILELGSGNSELLENLAKLGYKRLTGSDFSWNIINLRKNQDHSLKRGIKWQILDITKEWPPRQVDCIFEKAVLDCIPIGMLGDVLKRIRKSLRPEGLFLHVSHSKPQKKIKLLAGWDVKVYELPKVAIPMFQQIDKGLAYYLYVCMRGQG